MLNFSFSSVLTVTTMGSHIITLSSLACTDIYPDNTPAAFTNKLEKVLELDSNSNYEVSLVNIYHPKEFYGIVGNDEGSGVYLILYIVRAGRGAKTAYRMSEIKLEDNLLSGDLSYIAAYVNKMLTREAIKLIQSQQEYMHEKGFVEYNHVSQRVHLNYKHKTIPHADEKPGDIATIKLRFRGRISDIFGFDAGVEYQIYGHDDERTPGIRDGDKILSPFPPATASGVDFIMVYSDIVERTYFGGRKVNILDILNMESGGRGYHNTIYFPVSTKTIDEVSIKLTDQRGRTIHFKDNSNTICVLRIKSTNPV